MLWFISFHRHMTKKLSLFDTSLDNVLDCLEERYSNFLGPKIYTNFGSILIAVNPIYLSSDEYSNIYNQRVLTNADAHIYSVAKRAVDMIRPGSQETIVVIGDSGSGKTVTVGHVLDFLTSNLRSSQCDLFYEKILSTSHLMELFANAQTCLNTNSSRFGKLISLVYSCGVVSQLEGAEIEAFLLEKSRVTSTPDPGGCGENFHILRLLVSETKDAQFFERIFSFPLHDLMSGEFSFRVAPYCSGLTEKWFSFDRARHLLAIFGFDDSTQMEIYKSLAVILHLCNLEFLSRDDALGCDISIQQPTVHTSVMALVSLLGINDYREIQQAFTTKPVSALSNRRQSVYRKPCGVAESEGRRNSLARLLYLQIFEFVMQKVTSSVAPNVYPAKASKISVLDIFGFENFTKSHNDFEQLCINFCNEKIQQHFARICINDVRKELTAEGVDVKMVDPMYLENDSVLSLFESAPSGIFCMLDEKCRLNRAGVNSPAASTKLTPKPFQKSQTFAGSGSPNVLSSDDFFQTLCQNFKSSQNKRIKLALDGSCQFTIHHYCGPVTYSCDNFVEKSRDDVSPDLIAFFSLQIKNQFVAALLSAKNKNGCTTNAFQVTKNSTPLTPQTPTKQDNGGTVRKRSLPAKYRSATSSLISFLGSSSNVHYVRCIRPNAHPASAERSIKDRNFDRHHVASQLASAGLVDVLRLANATGTLTRRFTYRAFANGFVVVFRVLGIKLCLNLNEEIHDKENLYDSGKKVCSRSNSVVSLPDEQLEQDVRLLCEILSIAEDSKELLFCKTKIFLSDQMLFFFRRLQQLIHRRAAYTIQRVFKKILSNKKKAAEIRRRELELKAKEEDEKKLIQPSKKVVETLAPSLTVSYSPLYKPSTNFFITADIVSRRRHFLTSSCQPFWFHVRPNPVLQGAHVVNANLFQNFSITDCLD